LSKGGFQEAAATGNALLVRVKRNQPSLHDALAALCGAQQPIDRHVSVDRHRHGRQEHRLTEVFEVDDRLGPEWQPLIACAARISRLTWLKDTRSGLWTAREDVAYYACQIRLDAATLAHAVRHHWGIENRDHHVRDRILGEDDSRIRRQPGRFARLRSLARNILRANGIGNVRQTLYRNALDLDCLLAYAVA
jgi:predicted transposase YbfD/YdcC